MKIKKLELVNFRCFESVTLELDEHLTVLVGENGDGKTSVTDALAIGLDRIVHYFRGKGGRFTSWRLEKEDIYLDKEGHQAEFVSIETTTYPVSIPNVVTDEHYLAWTENLSQGKTGRYRRTHRSIHGDDAMYDYLLKTSRQEVLDDIPLCVYYDAGRYMPELRGVTSDLGRKYGLADVFHESLDASNDFSSFAKWFYATEGRELRYARDSDDTSFRQKELEVVRQAVRNMIGGVKEIFFSESADLMVRWDDKRGRRNLSAHQLSNGQKAILSLAADLAYRLAVVNEDKEKEAILASECIVIIDEIDLHLHPKWQQRVLEDLQKTFKGAQFVVTTHSPFVVTTVRSECVHIVHPDGIQRCPMPTYGAKASDVVGEVFDISNQRPPNNPNTRKIKKMFDAIDRGEGEVARKYLSELQNKWAKGYPVPDLNRADIMIRRLEARSARKQGHDT